MKDMLTPEEIKEALKIAHDGGFEVEAAPVIAKLRREGWKSGEEIEAAIEQAETAQIVRSTHENSRQIDIEVKAARSAALAEVGDFIQSAYTEMKKGLAVIDLTMSEAYRYAFESLIQSVRDDDMKVIPMSGAEEKALKAMMK